MGIMKHPAKNMKQPRLELESSRSTPKHPSQLSCLYFSERMHPQRYLIGVDREKYSLLNSTLVTVIMS
jgi:hypothetical protein